MYEMGLHASIPPNSCCPDVRMTALAASEGIRQAIKTIQFHPDSHTPGLLFGAIGQLEALAQCLLEASGGTIRTVEREGGGPCAHHSEE